MTILCDIQGCNRLSTIIFAAGHQICKHVNFSNMFTNSPWENRSKSYECIFLEFTIEHLCIQWYSFLWQFQDKIGWMHSINSSWHIYMYIYIKYSQFFNLISLNSIIWFLQMLAIKLLLQVISYIKMLYPFYVYNLPVFSWTELWKPIPLSLYGHPESVLWAGRKRFEILRLTIETL